MLKRILATFCAASLTASAIQIKLDYTYDTNGFFNRPGSKEALRAVADFYEKLLNDQLSAIDQSQWTAGNTWSATINHPGTGSNIPIPNLVVPANTIIVYAGGRSLGGPAGIGGPGGYSASGTTQSWFNLLDSRGQAGALASPVTDFGPWGGSITFETAFAWNFSLTTPEQENFAILSFVPIALHELGHLLGIGTAASWQAKIVGNLFTGPASVTAYGANVPLGLDDNGNYSHWRDDGDDSCIFPDGYDPDDPNNVLSKTYGSFGAIHGFNQIALMDPRLCPAGTYHKVMTDLDLAALKDIGWNLIPPARWASYNVNPVAGPVQFSWPSTSSFTYRLERSTTLASGSWVPLVSPAGNGLIQSHTDNSPPPGKAFYRINLNPPLPPAFITPVRTVDAPSSREPVMSSGCGYTAGCCR